MQNYKMIIGYDGRKYVGFNNSKGNSEKTIQGKLENILFKLYDEKIEVIGAVNTDSGVHAKAQVVNFNISNDKLTMNELFEYFEKYLTDDIVVYSIEEESERFHSRYNLKTVTYEYRLWKKDSKHRPLFERQYVNLMNQKLDISRIKEAVTSIEGEHDFLGFTSNKKTRKSFKKISETEIIETENEIIIRLSANGFLLNMERIIVGTLVQIGLGQLPLDVIEKVLESKNVDEAGHKASAGALTLVSLKY